MWRDGHCFPKFSNSSSTRDRTLTSGSGNLRTIHYTMEPDQSSASPITIGLTIENVNEGAKITFTLDRCSYQTYQDYDVDLTQEEVNCLIDFLENALFDLNTSRFDPDFAISSHRFQNDATKV